MYELLTGSTPLTGPMLGRDLVKALTKILTSDLQRPSLRLSSSQDTSANISSQRRIAPSRLHQILVGELDWVVMKSLERERKRRYETADGFAQDIRRFLADEPVLARPPSAGYRIKKFVKKHLGVVVATCCVLLALVTASVISTVFYLEADFQRGEAEVQKKMAQQEAKAHSRVSDKLTEVINSGDPIFGALLSKYGRLDSPSTIREVIDKLTEEELTEKSDLKDVPLVRAKHLDTLGDKQVAFGNLRQGYTLYTKAERLFQQVGFPNNMEYAKNLMAIGTCDYIYGDIASAKQKLKQAIAILQPVNSPAPSDRFTVRDLAFTRFVLAAVYVETEDFDKARQLLDEFIQMNPDAAPEMALQISMARILRAVFTAYEAEIQSKNAWVTEPVVVEAVTTFMKSPKNQELLQPFQFVFASEVSHEMLGTPTLPAYRKMHEMLCEVTEANHFLTVLSRYGMAYSAARDGDFDLADELCTELEDFVTAQLGRQHPRFAMVLHLHADLLFDKYRKTRPKDITLLQKAQQLAAEAVELRSQKIGEHRMTGSSLVLLGRIEHYLQNYDDGLTHLLRAKAIHEKTYGTKHSVVARTYRYILDLLISAKRYDSAEAYSRDLLTLAQELVNVGQLKPGRLGHYQLYLARILMFEKTDLAKAEIRTILLDAKTNLQTDTPFTDGLLKKVEWRLKLVQPDSQQE